MADLARSPKKELKKLYSQTFPTLLLSLPGLTPLSRAGRWRLEAGQTALFPHAAVETPLAALDGSPQAARHNGLFVALWERLDYNKKICAPIYRSRATRMPRARAGQRDA
jgi:hypothetical protein